MKGKIHRDKASSCCERYDLGTAKEGAGLTGWLKGRHERLQYTSVVVSFGPD